MDKKKLKWLVLNGLLMVPERLELSTFAYYLVEARY